MKALNDIITEHFKLAAADIMDTLTSKDIPEWDSMNYLLFIADVEKEYGISFTMDEMLGVQTLGDIKNILRGKGVMV
jgi:acyl carrier protein